MPRSPVAQFTELNRRVLAPRSLVAQFAELNIRVLAPKSPIAQFVELNSSGGSWSPGAQ